VTDMYLHCHPGTYRKVLRHLGVKARFDTAISPEHIERELAILDLPDAFKIIEHVIRNPSLIEDENEVRRIDNYEAEKIYAKISDPSRALMQTLWCLRKRAGLIDTR
jgi:hypothetical protein